MECKARLRGLERVISSKTIRPRLWNAKPACAGYSGLFTQRPSTCSMALKLRSGWSAAYPAKRRTVSGFSTPRPPLLPVWVERELGDEGQKRIEMQQPGHDPNIQLSNSPNSITYAAYQSTTLMALMRPSNRSSIAHSGIDETVVAIIAAINVPIGTIW